VTNVRTEDVIVTRGTEAEPLPEGIARKVLEAPIILRGDMVLIDGLRRLRRAQALGLERIPAIVSSSYPDIMEALTLQNGDMRFRAKPRRVWEISQLVSGLGIAWSRSTGNGGWDAQPGGERIRRQRQVVRLNKENSARLLLVAALGYSRTATGLILTVYRRADSGDVTAQAVIKEVDAGSLTPQLASKRLNKPHGFFGNVIDSDEQRRLLDRGTSGLVAQVDALLKLGYPVQLPNKELNGYIQAMYDARSQLSTLINGLRNMAKENKDG